MNRRLYKGARYHKIPMQTHEEYLNLLLEQCNLEYEIATEAQSQGHDLRIEVEIPQAHDLAQRTQQLLDFTASKKYGGTDTFTDRTPRGQS